MSENNTLQYIDTEIIIAWLENSLTLEEKKIFEQRLIDNPKFKKEVEDIRFIWNVTEQLKLQQEIKINPYWKKTTNQIQWLRSRDKAWIYMQALAVIAFIPLLIGIYYYSGQLFSLKNTTPEEIEITTAHGLISKILLPDSSEVYLNSGSTLRYPQRFVGDTRIVSLKGEGYFKVKANPTDHFEVQLPDNLCIRAYGTEFNINAYEEQAWIETVLASGVVEVINKNQNTINRKFLSAGQMAFTFKGDSAILISDANVYAKTAWKEGRMVFRRAKMQEIARRLSQHFNVEVILQDKELLQYEYSATFTTETLTEILNLLTQSSPIQWHYIEPKKQEDLTYTKRMVIIKMRK